MLRQLLLVLALAGSPLLGRAALHYVSPVGDDAGPGTIDQPWKTVQKAADSLQPGDTAYIRGGVYSEAVAIHVSGTKAGGFISFLNYPGEQPILDGSTLVPPPDDYSGLFDIRDGGYLIIQGFELRNYKETQGAGAPSGIHVEGAAHDIQLRGNHIHDIEYDTADGNAFGISVYGTAAAHPLMNVVIDGNEVDHLKTGNSESVSLNGNVKNFAVTNNRVHDNNNIGIDFIGFEKTCPSAGVDQARDGLCQHNSVWNISSLHNPAYAGDTSATGIYCDGAARVTIERNTVFACDYGAELSSEHYGRTASACIFRDNFVFRCLHPGLSLGGYDAHTTGGAVRCQVTNNTFFQNDTGQSGYGEVLLQFRVSGCIFKNNLFCAGPAGLFIANGTTTGVPSGNVFDYNLYFSPLGLMDSSWTWKNLPLTGFANWKKAVHQDLHSLFTDPLLVDLQAPDLHLQAGSPARHAGYARLRVPPGTMDIDGQPRFTGSTIDIGADE